MAKRKKNKKPQQTIRVNSNTWIEVDIDIDPEEARKNHLRSLEISAGKQHYKDKNLK